MEPPFNDCGVAPIAVRELSLGRTLCPHNFAMGLELTYCLSFPGSTTDRFVDRFTGYSRHCNGVKDKESWSNNNVLILVKQSVKSIRA